MRFARPTTVLSSSPPILSKKFSPKSSLTTGARATNSETLLWKKSGMSEPPAKNYVVP